MMFFVDLAGGGGGYRMQDVTEHGQVVETTMVAPLFGIGALMPTPKDGEMTWYRGEARCAKIVQGMREQAKRETQRREKYR